MAEQWQIDYALMAGRAYQSNRKTINWFPISNGWVEIVNKHITNPTSGFEAVSFVKSDQIVISYTGTNGAGDAGADAALFAGVSTTQLFDAAKYYLQIKALYTNANITFTGHSLKKKGSSLCLALDSCQ